MASVYWSLQWRREHGIFTPIDQGSNVAVCQNLVPLVNIKIAGKWMFIPLKMALIGIDPYPCDDGGNLNMCGNLRTSGPRH